MECAAGCKTPLVSAYTSKIIYVCPSKHAMHAECVHKMYESNDNPVCPICRDDTMSLLKDMIIKNPHVKDSSSSEDSDSDSDSEYTIEAVESVLQRKINDKNGHSYFVESNSGTINITFNLTNPLP